MSDEQSERLPNAVNAVKDYAYGTDLRTSVCKDPPTILDQVWQLAFWAVDHYDHIDALTAENAKLREALKKLLDEVDEGTEANTHISRDVFIASRTALKSSAEAAVNEVAELRKRVEEGHSEYLLMRRYASYCNTCAKSGCLNPMTLIEFTERDAERKEPRDAAQ